MIGPPLIIYIKNDIAQYASVDDPLILDISGCLYTDILELNVAIQAIMNTNQKYIVVYSSDAMSKARRLNENYDLLTMTIYNRVLFIVDEGREVSIEHKI